MSDSEAILTLQHRVPPSPRKLPWWFVFKRHVSAPVYLSWFHRSDLDLKQFRLTRRFLVKQIFCLVYWAKFLLVRALY